MKGTPRALVSHWTKTGQVKFQADDWPDPTPEMLLDPRFTAVWECIKTWDINVPGQYEGYMGATGNHVRAILEALEISPIPR